MGSKQTVRWGGIGFPIFLPVVLMLGGLVAHAGEAPANMAISLDAGSSAYEVVDTTTLGEQRARQGVTSIQLGQIHSRIDLANNQVTGSSSGMNLLAAGAFDNARGISTVIQNSGHNVAIQESMIVNITINP